MVFEGKLDRIGLLVGEETDTFDSAVESFTLNGDAMIRVTRNDLPKVRVVAFDQLGDEIAIVEFKCGLTVRKGYFEFT